MRGPLFPTPGVAFRPLRTAVPGPPTSLHMVMLTRR